MASRQEWVTETIFFYFRTKAYVVDTQKNNLNKKTLAPKTNSKIIIKKQIHNVTLKSFVYLDI